MTKQNGDKLVTFGIRNRAKIIEGVACLDNFCVGTVRGAWYPTPVGVDLGRLTSTEDTHGWYELDWDKPVYVVYSYGTPIAWRQAGGSWVMPNIHWSRTTSHHQSLVRQGAKAWDDKCEGAIVHL